MKIIFDYFDGADPDNVADEVRRVADQIEEGYVSGELVSGDGRGWWSVEK